MSYDYTWILNSTYDSTVRADKDLTSRKNRAARELKDAEEKLKSAKDSAEKFNKEEYENRLSEENERLQSLIEDSGEGIKAEIKRQNAEINRRMRDLERQLDGVSGKIDQTGRKVDSLSDKMGELVREIGEKDESDKSKAVQLYNVLLQLYNRAGELNSGKLTPDEAKDLQYYVNTTYENINEGLYEAAIGTVRDHSWDAGRLIETLEIKNNEFDALTDKIDGLKASICGRIAELLDKEKNVCGLDCDGETVMFDGDVRYWCDGIMDDIAEDFQKTADAYGKFRDEMDLDALRRTKDRLERVGPALDLCVELAHNEFCESNRLISLAVRVLSAVEEENWRPLKCGYDGDDRRRAFLADYTDGAGDIASFTFIPARAAERGRDGRPRRNPDGSLIYEKLPQFTLIIRRDGGESDPYKCEDIRGALFTSFALNGITGNQNRRTSADDERKASANERNREKDERISNARASLNIKLQRR